MREVTQSILAGDPSGIPGNCLQAAVASLLDLELHDVPHFVSADDDRVWEYALIGFAFANGYRATWRVSAVLPEFGLAYGPSERGVRHAVVVVGGEVAWDPHPSRAGLVAVREVVEFERVAS